MNRIVLSLVMVPFISAGCSDFEYRRRPDTSEVAVIRKIENVFPHVAKELTLGIDANLKLKEELTPIAIKGGYQNKVVQLYEALDQISANSRDFIVSNYLSYINADLDPDVNARQAGRIAWQAANKELQERVLKLRGIKLGIEAARKRTLQKEEREIEVAPEMLERVKGGTSSEKEMKWVPTREEALTAKEKAIEPTKASMEKEGAMVRKKAEREATLEEPARAIITEEVRAVEKVKPVEAAKEDREETPMARERERFVEKFAADPLYEELDSAIRQLQNIGVPAR